MDISSLAAFTAVAREASFSNAADCLYVTQPAVSKRVAGLEQELGVELFHRVARRVSLTEAGRQLLPKAVELINQAEDMKRYAASLGDEISGSLSVALSHHVGLHRMPPVFHQFNKRFPEVSLDLRFEDSDQALENVEQGNIEFAVITLPKIVPKQLKMESIWLDPLHLVAAPDHDLFTSNVLSIETLLDYPCVLTEQSTQTYNVVARALENANQLLNIRMQTNNLESLKMMVSVGLGWSALPSTMLDDSIKTLPLNVRLRRELGMVFHRQRSLSNAAKALVRLIRQSPR